MRRAECLVVSVLLACGAEAPRSPSPSPAATTHHAGDASVTLSPEADARLGVTLAPIERRSVPRIRKLPGEVVVRPGGALTIAAPVPGLVIATEGLPRPGATLRAGQTIARLVPLASVDRDLRARARSQVAAAEARMTAGESRARRAERLIDGGAGSERAAEDARVERDIAAAELEAARARLRMIERAPLASDVATELRAPFAAIVRQVFAADGQTVAGGAPLVELVADAPPWVRVPVPSTELATLADASAEVTPLADAAATIVAAAVVGPPTGDPIAGTVDRYFELPAGALRLGERVVVGLAAREHADARVVPASAILRDASGDAFVYVQVREHAYDRRRVEVLGVRDGGASLSRGPDVGAQVVSAGAVELYGVEFGVGH